ncbi:MAG: hypothetical protein K1X94_31860 [Sandaracinaceae bacterium]|nr:hypothetical protein [Sandaracinaceae bacterium]
MASSLPPLEIQRSAPGQAWTARGDLVVVRCATLIVAETVRALVTHARTRPQPAHLAVIYVLEGSVMGVPDEACRDAFVELSREGERVFTSAAVVIPAGFAAAVVRAFVGGVRMVARARLPFEVFERLEDADAFTRRHAAAASTLPDARALEDTIAALRAAG